MTMNCEMALIFRYSTKFGSLGTNYVNVVEDRLIGLLSAMECSPKNLAFDDMNYGDMLYVFFSSQHFAN